MFMTRRSTGALTSLLMMMALLRAEGGDAKPARTVVFVCEHGSVKSLIAMQWFNRRALERGVKYRAVSRGMTPDPSVPKGIAARLQEDGFAVENFTPARLSKVDVRDAVRVVSIGADITSVTMDSRVKVEEWGDVPPASENYASSREAIRKHIDALLTELEKKEKP